MDAATTDGIGRPAVWLDTTTTRHAGAAYDGTTRIERGLIRELPDCLGERLGFCAYDRAMRRFSAVGRPDLPAASLGARKQQNGKRGHLRAGGRMLERSARAAFRNGLGKAITALDLVRERQLFPAAAPGDVLLLAGENWGRHDFAFLRELRKRHGLRIAAVLQDMIPTVHPQFFDGPKFMAAFHRYIDFLATDTDLVLAISDHTRGDFLRAAPQTDPVKVVRIDIGADPGITDEQRRPAKLPEIGGRPFALSVSTIQVRKNFDLLYRLWQKFAMEGHDDQPHLVIVGREGFGSADLLNLMRNDPWIANTVTVLNDASDAELAWLYANCAFTLYPSWYEGWGLPLSESLAYGKTFIASDRSSLPEAGQGLGIHLDPYDLMSWRREVLRLTNDGAARSAMEERIIAERQLSSWSDCARSVSSALRRLTG